MPVWAQHVLVIVVPTVAVVASYFLNRRKVDRIQALVNGRLSAALAELEEMRRLSGVDSS